MRIRTPRLHAPTTAGVLITAAMFASTGFAQSTTSPQTETEDRYRNDTQADCSRMTGANRTDCEKRAMERSSSTGAGDTADGTGYDAASTGDANRSATDASTGDVPSDRASGTSNVGSDTTRTNTSDRTRVSQGTGTATGTSSSSESSTATGTSATGTTGARGTTTSTDTSTTETGSSEATRNNTSHEVAPNDADPRTGREPQGNWAGTDPDKAGKDDADQPAE